MNSYIIIIVLVIIKNKTNGIFSTNIGMIVLLKLIQLKGWLKLQWNTFVSTKYLVYFLL